MPTSPAGSAASCAGLVPAAAEMRLPLVVPLHPRSRAALERSGLASELAATRAQLLEPLGYLEFLALLAATAAVLTDSGGVQEEACILGVPCVTLRDNTERPESLGVGANRHAGADPERIAAATVAALASGRSWEQPLGDGQAGERIAEHVLRMRA